MKFTFWLIGGFILAGIWAGSFYISSDIQYSGIFWIIKLIWTILGLIIPIWIISSLINGDYNDNYHDKKEPFLKTYWRPILSVSLLISIQYAIWWNDYVDNQIKSIAQGFSNHIEFPWNGAVPRFYIWDKPQK